MKISRQPGDEGRIGKIAAGGCAVLPMMLIFWWMSSQTSPVVHIPTPTLPNPNAFDTFQAASSQLLESVKIDNALYTPEDAKKAGVPVLTRSDREKLIAENAPALATLRTGLNQDYGNPPARSFYTLMPYYGKFRKLARFLTVDASVHAAKADYGGAARCSLDAVELGVQIPRGSTLMGGLSGLLCQRVGRKPLWQVVEHLDESNAKASAQRLEKIRRKEFTYAETLQEEKWAGQAGLLEFFRRRNSGGALFSVAGAGPNGPLANPAISRAAFSLFYLVYSKQRIMNDYTNYMDAIMARAKEPYNAKRAAIPVPQDPFIAMIAPIYEQVELNWIENETQNDLLEVTLALRAFRLRHGAYPDTLSQLAPEILQTLPTDPFTAGQPLQYRHSGNSYVLYSIGPDGKDDGGRIIDAGPSPAEGKEQRYVVKPDSKGDVVAGKNLR